MHSSQQGELAVSSVLGVKGLTILCNDFLIPLLCIDYYSETTPRSPEVVSKANRDRANRESKIGTTGKASTV